MAKAPAATLMHVQVGIHMTPDYDPVVRCLCGQFVPLAEWKQHESLDLMGALVFRMMGALVFRMVGEALEVQVGPETTWPGVGAAIVPYLQAGYERLFHRTPTVLVIGGSEPSRPPTWMTQDWQGYWTLTEDPKVDVCFSTALPPGRLRMESRP